MDLQSMTIAQFGTPADAQPQKAEDAYYRRHETGRTAGTRLIVPLVVGFAFCLAAVGLLSA